MFKYQIYGEQKMVLTLSDLSKKYSVSSQTLKRVVSKNEQALKQYIKRGIRNRIEFFDDKGVDYFMSLVANQTRWSPKKSALKKNRKKESNKKASTKVFFDMPLPELTNADKVIDTEKKINTTELSMEKQLIISLKDHNNSLKKQLEIHKEDKKRFVNQLNELQLSFSQLHQEKDKLLFEIAAWRGIYGKIEDQKALVPVEIFKKNGIIGSLKKKLSSIFTK